MRYLAVGCAFSKRPMEGPLTILWNFYHPYQQTRRFPSCRSQGTCSQGKRLFLSTPLFICRSLSLSFHRSVSGQRTLSTLVNGEYGRASIIHHVSSPHSKIRSGRFPELKGRATNLGNDERRDILSLGRGRNLE